MTLATDAGRGLFAALALAANLWCTAGPNVAEPAGERGFFATAAAPTPAIAIQDVRVRVMTYNIAAGSGTLDSIAAVIRASSADVVALQEVDVHWSDRSNFADQATRLGELLTMQVRFAPIYRNAVADSTQPPREFGVALLSRYPVVTFTNRSLARMSTQQANAAVVPMPGLLDATVDVRGIPLRVLNTHLDYRADPAVRAQQVREMLAVIGDTAVALLLMGDLNAPPNAPELAPLFLRLRDAWHDQSDAGFTYPASAPSKRIDYVLTSADIGVVAANVPDTRASDHRPVIADLMLRAGPARPATAPRETSGNSLRELQ